ncbi:putative quinol monooxygenase [Sporichthya sp.]|uniref:putative quinol monooxygenase n=1 Tax=Sporichthya sp. TaxID=65475 RepID=UPI0017C9E21A|nr:antibiotic biosynthesis monooxygenase family protein [Sporichthya sp.]MBA3745721.1 antibiotic biosynthesis monooxygenase [Sporichthya sp.]
MAVTEKAELQVAEDKADEFEDVLTKAADLVLVPGGCRSLQVGRGIERPNVFLLTVSWDSVEHHNTWRETPAFAEFVGLIKEYLTGPTGMEHFGPLLDR